ncbi:MAG: PAS domain S-box protein [Candidatus Scalindua sp.]|nr:PAS domain S-box protein [Candidatus Scalindua sp.]
MKKRTSEQKKKAELRKRAESKLKSGVPVSEEISNTDMKKLIHELEVHQIELEMQNDELLKTQIKLEKSKERYANLYDFAPVGYLTFDEEGLIREANLTIADMLDVPRTLLINSRFHYFVKGEGQDIFYLHTKRVFEGKKAETREVRVKGKSGREFYVRLDSRRVQETMNNITCRTAVTDITEQKKMENLLKESEEKHRKLIETAQDAIVCDVNQVITDWNRSAEKIFGYSRREIIGKPISLLIPEKYRRDHDEGLKRYFKTGESRIIGKTVEVSGITKEGIEIPLEMSLAHQKLRKGQDLFTAIIRDITKRRNTIMALQQSEEKYRTLVQAIPEIVYKIDENGYFTFLNNAIRNLGYEPEELIGKHFSKILHPDDVKNFSRSRVLQKYSGVKAKEGETPKLFDERRSNKRMTRNLEVRLVAKSQDSVKGDREGRKGLLTSFGEIIATGHYYDKAYNHTRRFGGTVGIIIDITEKVKLQAEMIHAGQLALIGELAAGVAHEINNPIFSIINFAQLIADESDRDSRAHTFGKLIMEEGNRIADLTKNLVSLSRSPAGPKISVNIHELISNSLKVVKIQLKKDHIIIKDTIPKDIPLIIANPQEIHQVFLNLTLNARYALNKKYPCKDKDKILEISCNTDLIEGHQYVRITFYDRGIGIPEEILHKVKSFFFTTKPFNKGTGLGLSLCENIINNHGGKIAVDSIQGEYTKVVISLPATECTTEK